MLLTDMPCVWLLTYSLFKFSLSALLQDMEGLRGQLEGELDSISLKRIMVQIQDKLISTQEIGDDKLQIVQHILDIIENRQRQLELDCKNLGL